MKQDNSANLGFLIHDVARLLRSRFEERANAHGLSAAQWRLLVRLWKEEGVSQARLATMLEVEPISISRLLDRMEQGGWIERRIDPADRRVKVVHPTDKSRAVYGAMKEVAASVYDEAFQGFSAKERTSFADKLAAMARNLAATRPNDQLEDRRDAAA